MRKYTVFTFATGDFKAVERYLNEQAAKGWELEKVGAVLARWKKTGRTDLRWCVDLANPKENNDREARRDYIRFCAEGGWELFALRGNMYFFKSMPGWNPPPVQTDPELERKRYNKYYIKSTILSAIYIVALLAFYAFLFLAAQRDLDYALQSTKMTWHTHWLAVGTMLALPLWGLWALWRLADFVRAMISNRGGVIGVPPRWVMWANCAVSALGGLGAALFFLGLGLESVVQAEFTGSLYVLAAVWAGALLFRAFTYEFELYQGEVKFIRNLGLFVLAVFVVMIVGRVAAPYGEWTTSSFDYMRDYNGALAQYALLEDVPVVRGEDLGMPLEDSGNNYLTITYECTPMGRRWEVENDYWDSRMSQIGCETFVCPFRWQAEVVRDQMLSEIKWWSDSLNRENIASYIVLTAPPQVEMEAVTLDWADEAWYGENDNASVLVVRVGAQVTRLSAPKALLTEGLLPVIRARLTE